MFNMITKWGAVIVGLIVIATIVMQFSSSVSGLSNWFGDNYLPKKYLIIEKYPVRLILYGQFRDYNYDKNSTYKSSIKTSDIIKLIQTIETVKYREGKFSKYQMDVNFDSDFNSKQIRSSDRSLNTVLNKKEKE